MRQRKNDNPVISLPNLHLYSKLYYFYETKKLTLCAVWKSIHISERDIKYYISTSKSSQNSSTHSIPTHVWYQMFPTAVLNPIN